MDIFQGTFCFQIFYKTSDQVGAYCYPTCAVDSLSCWGWGRCWWRGWLVGWRNSRGKAARSGIRSTTETGTSPWRSPCSHCPGRRLEDDAICTSAHNRSHLCISWFAFSCKKMGFGNWMMSVRIMAEVLRTHMGPLGPFASSRRQ